MTFDWLKSFPARIGIEGRNVIVVSSLCFCGFVLWTVLRTYADHPRLSIVLGSVVLALGVATVSVALLVKPQPADVTPRFLFQQVGKQLLYASGMQSQEEIVSLLKEAHNIKELPAPAAVVRGSASDPTSYKTLSPQAAAELVRYDRENVERLLHEEAARVLSATIKHPGQALRETKSRKTLESATTDPDK